MVPEAAVIAPPADMSVPALMLVEAETLELDDSDEPLIAAPAVMEPFVLKLPLVTFQ
jgi:hypothetical protein